MSIASVYRGNKTFEVVSKTTRKPEIGQVAIDVAYCGICGTDMHVYHSNMDTRVGFERTIGHEMSGVVAEVGEGVNDITVGDRVVVRPLSPCGDCPACQEGHNHICHKLNFLGLDSDSALQERWIVPSFTIHKLPKEIGLDIAALVEPISVACHNVERADMKGGEDVVVIGGGPIGVLVALVARAAGGNVLISEVNEARLHIAKDMGFDVINPIKENLQETVDKRTNNKRAEIVFEVSGSQAGIDAMTEVAASRGKIVMVAIHAQKPSIDLFQFFWRELQLIGSRVYTAADYDKAIELIASNTIDCAKLITDCTPLSDIQKAFDTLDNAPNAMKSLIEIGGQK